MTGQSRLGSLIEAFANIGIGMFVALGAQLVIFSAYGIKLPLHDNLVIVGYFTVISILRSYFVRRFFNWWHTR